MSNPLLDLTADLSRREAGQPLKFPERKITAVPHDPLAYAVRNIDSARADLEFALAEAWNSRDVEGMKQLVQHIEACADGLLVVETMARDLQGRMQEPK